MSTNHKEVQAADAFIGLDISVEPPPQARAPSRLAASAPQRNRAPAPLQSHADVRGRRQSRGRKRPRAPPAASAEVRRPRGKKPRPPPPPPLSLVSLLRNDANVRSYFESLQENLDYDVEKWKREAAKWKRLAEGGSKPSTRKRPVAPRKGRRKGVTANRRPPGGATVGAGEDVEATREVGGHSSSGPMAKVSCEGKAIQKNDDDAQSIIIPITDETLFEDLGSSDSEEGSDNRGGQIPCSSVKGDGPCADTEPTKPSPAPPSLATPSPVSGSKSASSCDVEAGRHAHILEKLREAKLLLDSLGVSLVEVEVVSTATPPLEANLETDIEGGVAEGVTSVTVERILHRQPDEKVAAEMMASLKTLITASSLVGESSPAGADTKEDNKSLSEEDRGEHEHFLGGDGAHGLSNEERAQRRRVRRWYHPFCRRGRLHVPIAYPSGFVGLSDACSPHQPSHPASVGLTRLIDVLWIMDVYCKDDMEDDQWNAIFQYDENHWRASDAEGRGDKDEDDGEDKGKDKDCPLCDENAELNMGMRGRRRLARRVLSSLDIEITQAWAPADRAAALGAATVHFHQADILDAGDDDELEGDDDSGAGVKNDKFYGTRSYNRLANLEERIGHARVAALLRRRDGDLIEVARLVAGYVISASPSLDAERYPMLPPVLSLCVLEALLAPEDYVPCDSAVVSAGDGKNQFRHGTGEQGEESLADKEVKDAKVDDVGAPTMRLEIAKKLHSHLTEETGFQLPSPKPSSSSESEDDPGYDKSKAFGLASDEPKAPAKAWEWFEEHIQEMFATARRTDRLASLVLMAIAHPVHVAAAIWKERSTCADDRVRDVASVEVAAYERIQKLAPWLSNSPFEGMDNKRIANVGEEILEKATSMHLDNTADLDKAMAAVGLCCYILLLSLGDEDRIVQLCDKILKPDNGNSTTEGEAHILLFLLPACCRAYVSVANLKWEMMKLGDAGGRRTAAACTVTDNFSPILDSVARLVRPNDWQTIEVIIQCRLLLGDGLGMRRLARTVVPNLTKAVMARDEKGSIISTNQRRIASRMMTSFVDAAEIPTVRVINLKRRPDRLLDFMGCAVRREQLLVIRGPGKLRRKALIAARNNARTLFISPGEKDVPGEYAFDGQCSREDLDEQVKQQSEGNGSLSDFVKAKWRPGELKAFDRDARNDFELVHTSMTEKACALSHISSWMGVESTLSDANTGARGEYDSKWYSRKLLRMFDISGFARGPALLSENVEMDPVPVCVILEDDAVLTDRFAERLASLLEDLPRDFHFCSLGYSRPRTAPMVEYSTHLGIPSCLWYLTGYILSLEGARYLIKGLPVIGPVDSWIGLKMCGNWDNSFGDMMGVGKYSKAKAKLPSRKDLSTIMKFRAFAALVPLCAQKVGTVSAAVALTRGGWRDKDTDITYSG